MSNLTPDSPVGSVFGQKASATPTVALSSSTDPPVSRLVDDMGSTGGAATGGASTGGAAGASNIGIITIKEVTEAAIVRALGGQSTGAWSESGGGSGGDGVAPWPTKASENS